jgi:hypothetical protein
MTIMLSDKYPKLIRDFYLFDKSKQAQPTGITDYNDILCSGIAHMPLQLPWQFNTENLLAEAKHLNYHHKDSKYSWVYGVPGTIKDKYATKLNTASQGAYITHKIKKYYTYKEEYNELIKMSLFKVMIDMLGELVTVTDVIVKKLGPNDYIMPHTDVDVNPWKIYIPLNWPKGNHFKIFKQGTVDMVPGQPYWINVGEHAHSIVNDSNEDRYIVSIYADWHTEEWKQVVETSWQNLK